MADLRGKLSKRVEAILFRRYERNMANPQEAKSHDIMAECELFQSVVDDSEKMDYSLSDLVRLYFEYLKQDYEKTKTQESLADSYEDEVRAAGYDETVSVDDLITDDRLLDAVSMYGTERTPWEMRDDAKATRKALYEKDRNLRADLRSMYSSGCFKPSPCVWSYQIDMRIYGALWDEFATDRRVPDVKGIQEEIDSDKNLSSEF